MSAILHADQYVQTLSKQKRTYEFEATDVKGFIKWQNEFRADLEEALGLVRIRVRAGPLHPKKTESVTLDDHVRETWSIESETGYHVPFYLLLPKNVSSPWPLVITPHGHGKRGKDTYAGIAHDEQEKEHIEEGERDIALQAVRRGYAVIAPDQRAFGETRFVEDIESDQNNSCQRMQMHALMFGRTLIGERVFDIGRLIDFAQQRKDIDATRVTVTGNSGGGTATLFAAAMDERIKVAIPGSYFCTFADSIGAMRHCACNYVPNMMRMGEMADVAGLIAPRAFLAVNGKDDPIFPIEATRRAFASLQRIYSVANASDRCALYVGTGGHRYYKSPVWPFVKKFG